MSKAMNDCQVAFEQWTRRCNGSWADKALTKHPDGRYNVLQTWNDWIAWQGAWECSKPDIEMIKTIREWASVAVSTPALSKADLILVLENVAVELLKVITKEVNNV